MLDEPATDLSSILLIMAQNEIGQLPFRLEVLDIDQPISHDEIKLLSNPGKGVSLCIRSKNGDPKRGGYFFHICLSDSKYQIFDIEKNSVDTVEIDFLVAFINHVSGRLFNATIQIYCQSTINLRKDQIG